MTDVGMFGSHFSQAMQMWIWHNVRRLYPAGRLLGPFPQTSGNSSQIKLFPTLVPDTDLPSSLLPDLLDIPGPQSFIPLHNAGPNNHPKGQLLEFWDNTILFIFFINSLGNPYCFLVITNINITLVTPYHPFPIT
jgi:hypothetical protein